MDQSNHRRKLPENAAIISGEKLSVETLQWLVNQSKELKALKTGQKNYSPSILKAWDENLAQIERSILQRDPKLFTVIGYFEDTGQSVCDHVIANNGFHAFWVAAQTRPDLTMVVSLPGHATQAEGQVIFPGEGVVDADTILQLPEVYGPAK